MKNTLVIILTLIFAFDAFGQPTEPPAKPVKKPIVRKNPAREKAELEKASAIAVAAERVAALVKFVEDYPKSKERNRVLELITVGRAALADGKMQAGEKSEGIELFKLALRDAPKPLSDKLFTEVVLQIPNSLLYRGEAAAAIEAAKLVEEKAEGNAKQLLAAATFYLGLENAAEAKRLADKAIVLEPDLPAAYQTLGLAYRLDFQLEESANAYATALQLDPNSTASKRSLAEMKRATGKVSEAAALYREILTNDAADGTAQTGLILALFDAENKTEAESELAKSLEANPNNLFLLVGAAYWYAAHNNGAKAIELAEKAVAVEPRYTWARIALARGLIQQKRPLEAEKALLAARQYGDFPTLDYELAAVRMHAGFYREAAETLQKKFSVNDGFVLTRLGNRVNRQGKSFIELLAAERRASIFQTLAADNIEDADKLEALLNLTQKIERSTDEEISSAVDEFTQGADKMKVYRQLFAAEQLLQKRKSPAKILQLTKAAIGGVDAGLDSPDSASAVLADELYQSRQLALARSELIIVPEVPRRTLSDILRGRIEDISGWALFQENKSAEAVTRLKRAVSVLPEKSSWWRSAVWRLGTAQENAGNLKDALDNYVKSYTNGDADIFKYNVIESAYQKLNGSTDGLESKIGAKPASFAANLPVQTEVKTNEQITAQVEPTPEAKIEPTPEIPTTETPVKTEATPEIKPEPTPQETPQPQTEPSPETQSETRAEPIAENQTEVKTEPTPEPSPEATKTEIPKTETPVEKADQSEPKPLFEPIIINVPKVEPRKKPTPETPTTENPTNPETTNKTATENPANAEPAPKSVEETNSQPIEETVQPEPPPTENKPVETVQESKPLVENPATRPRRVTIESRPEATIAPCSLTVSQERVSILNDGGNSSLLVGIEGETEAQPIKATSSNPSDVEVVLEPEIRVLSGRSFFIVKSISPAVGMFTVTFEAACGKKEVIVKVR